MTQHRRDAWRWYGAHLVRERWPLTIVVVASAVTALANLPVLWLIRHALDTAIPQRNIPAIVAAGAGILAFRLLASGLIIAVARPTARRTRRITAAIRTDLMAMLYRLRWQDRAALEGARAQGRIVHETEIVEQMTHGVFQSMLPAIIPALVYLAVLATLSVRLTIIMLVLTPLLRLLTWLTTRRLKRAIAGFQQAFETFNMGTQRALAMLPVAKVQASEPAILGAHQDNAAALGTAGADMVAASTINTQAGVVTTSIVAAVTLVVGGIAVADGTMTTGALAAFFVAASQVNAALGVLIGGVPLLLSGDEALRRLAQLRAIGTPESPGGTTLPDLRQPLVIDNVGFGYAGHRLFDGITMAVPPGQLTAIAAINGEGKTSLLELILGLHQPESGTLRLGPDPLSTLDLAAYRGAIGVVPQHPAFFAGSVRDNILFGRTGIGDGALQQAIHRAALDPVLQGLARGLDTPMGDGGQLLSGGERQRVAIARALVHAPALLILDEPSNHLDTDAIALIITRLLTAPDRPTCLVATHDPRLLALADRVYDLANGVLVLRPLIRLAASQ